MVCPPLMVTATFCLAMAGGGAWAASEDQGVMAGDGDVLTLPSGLQTHLQEMLWDRPGAGLVYRFRFVAPEFATEGLDFDALREDMDHLCNEFALTRLANVGPAPAQIIISLADRASEFGVYDPDVNQVFEAYSVENDSCIWEVF